MNILEFGNYRTFLKSYLEDAHRRNASFNASSFARKLDLKSNTSLIKILRGQREAGPEIQRRISHYFKFTDREARYFEDLVSLSRSRRDPAQSYLLMKRMQALKPNFRLLNDEEFAAISHWWFYAIKQMTRLKDFKADPSWIAKKLCFKISLKDVSKALAIMLEIGILEKDCTSGRLRATHKALNTSDEIASEGIKRFHEGMIENAKQAVRTCPVADRLMAGMTFGVRHEDVPRAKAWLNQMLGEFADKFESEQPERIYQAQVQFFPLTRKEGET